ncbi:AASS [Cordylochernes scorpioides]|uniref:AASS n=1 Tax=Cordylochernes scorpioides TaxID=51811 RepID=A0ABY6LHB6_9ARAC|nr:AASS [Cordylochernes scorpioides]
MCPQPTIVGTEPGERDVVILRHQVGVTRADGSHEEHRLCLVEYGDPNGYSAIARTVSYPVAIAAQLLLQGAFGSLSGALRPCIPQIYRPLWAALRREGFVTTESIYRS